MSLKDQIQKEVVQAVKSRDKARTGVLRFLQSAVKNKEIELRPNSIKEEEVRAVIQKQIKQVRESLEYYQSADQKDKVEEEEYKLSVLQTFLPKPLSEKELEAYIEKAVSELQPQSMKDMGRMMQWVMAQTKGAVEGKILSEKVKNRLQSL